MDYKYILYKEEEGKSIFLSSLVKQEDECTEKINLSMFVLRRFRVRMTWSIFNVTFSLLWLPSISFF
jgi:hypothetical protein